MRTKHELGYQPRGAPDDEERRLQVVARVVQKFDLLGPGHVRRAEDAAEPPANVVRVAFGPAHALTRQATKGADAFRRRLRVRRVNDFVAQCVEPQRQLPVLGQASAPADLAQKPRPDHVGSARDHFQRANELLERALDHVASGVLGSHRLGQPTLAPIQYMPLIALNRRYFQPRHVHPGVLTGALRPIEMWKESLDRVRKRKDVRVPNNHELG